MPPKELQKTLIVAVVAFLLLVSATYLSYRHTKSRTPQIVLPAGGTYLGPSPASEKPASSAGKIPVPADAAWATWTGKKFPYSFSYPTTLSLGFFPDDLFDAVTIFWNNTNPQENLLIRVEDLNVIPDMKDYVNKPKRQYVEHWWKQYGYTGIASIKNVTAASGITGFRARYTKSTGNATFDNVFFVVPNKPNLVIWLSGKHLEQHIFDRVVESVTWGK